MTDSSSILGILDTETDVEKLRSALHDVVVLLEPLLELGRTGKLAVDALRPVARTHGPVVASLVKSMGARLSPELKHTHEQLLVFGDAVSLGLNALDCLRPVLKASQHELDVQRYNIVRKMAGHGLHEHAMVQGKVLLSSAAENPGTVAGPGDLHIAAVANLLVCYSALVKQGAKRAEVLWKDIYGPVDHLLSLAREAADTGEAAKRLEVVLRCFSKVMETLQYASVACHLSPTAVVQQLSALTSCAALCRQEQYVQQRLVDDVAAAPDTVKRVMADALVHLIATQGSLAEPLLPMLHQLLLSLCQKRMGYATEMDDRLHGANPWVAIVHGALLLPHCRFEAVPDEQLCAILSTLASAAASLTAGLEVSGPFNWRLLWCCLDGLRVSITGALTQLLSSPQLAGGKLSSLAQCMELLCRASLELLEDGDIAEARVAFPSGTSAITTAVRLQVAHGLCSGQLSALPESMPQYMELLKRLMTSTKQRQRAGAASAIDPVVLYNLSASLGNAGLDLLQAQHAAPAADLLQAASDLALERMRQMRSLGCLIPETDVIQIVKKCKAHVTALQHVSLHDDAMAAAAGSVAHLHTFVDGKALILWPIVKQFVQSSLASYDATLEAAAAAASYSSASRSVDTKTVPAAPCKGQRRGGRLKRMQASAQEQSLQHAEQDTATGGQSTAVSAGPRVLVQSLAAAAAREKGSRSGLLNALDIYAVQELEVVREESKRREEESLLSLYSGIVLGTLRACASATGSSLILRARELLVKGVLSISPQEAQISDLHASCELLDCEIAVFQDGARPMSMAELSVLDSAALAHAHLGLCLAQSLLSRLSRPVDADVSGHIGKAINLWDRLLTARGGDQMALVLRMPQATLHAALQVQHYVNLLGNVHPEVATYSTNIVWRLMRGLKNQVKLREQQTFLLSATMPLTTCTEWAFAVQPSVPLAEIFKDTQQHRRLAEVLKVIEPVRNMYISDATDHAAAGATAEACASELERSGFLRHGPAPQILRSQFHQMAAAAHLRGGKTTLAYAQVQEALRITCALFMLLECTLPATKTDDTSSGETAAGTVEEHRNMTPAEATSATELPGAATIALDYTLDANLAGSMEQESLSGVATSAPNSSASGHRLSAGLAWAVGAAHLSSLHIAARVFEAAGSVEDAIWLWKQCSLTAELFGVSGMRSVSCACLAELSCRRGDAGAASKYLEAACGALTSDLQGCAVYGELYTFESALLKAHVCSVRARLSLLLQHIEQVDGAGQEGLVACGMALEVCGHRCVEASERRDALSWHVVCLRAQLERVRAEALLQLNHRQEAAELLQSAVEQLQQAASLSSSRSAAEIWPVDFGLLLAHRAAAASPTALRCHGSPFVVGMGDFPVTNYTVEHVPAHASYGVSDTTKHGALGADQSSKRGIKAKGSRSVLATSAKLKQQQQVQVPHQLDDASHLTCDVVDAVRCNIPALLQSLQLCWQLPLAAVYACRQLLHASIALGLPYAATMFLHLGHGMSYTQEQALQRASTWNGLKSASQSPEVSGLQLRTAECSDGRNSADGPATGCDPEQGETAISGNVQEAALSMLSGLRLFVASDANAILDLEAGAEAWLVGVLRALPVQSVVSSIVHDNEAGRLLVGRASRSGSPLLAVLPGASACTAGSERPASGSPACLTLDRCVLQLRQLLEESADSMQMDQDTTSSQSHKAKWWKTRVSLDERVKGLLKELDEQCLGPWRCLLLPVHSEHLDTWRSAADSFIGEHFSDQLDMSGSGGCTGVLRELLAVALSGMGHLQAPDLTGLLGVICSQLGLSCRPSGVSDLAVELAATEAAARVQLMKLQVAEQGTSSALASINPGRSADASAGAEVSGRTTTAAARSRTAGAQTSRARSGSSGPLQGAAAASMPGIKDSVRRPATGLSVVPSECMDTENTLPQAGGTFEAAGRARRTTRLAEPPCLTTASRNTARAASMWQTTRSRTGALGVSEDHHPSDGNKADVTRGTTKSSGALGSGISMAVRPKAQLGGAVERVPGSVLLMLSPALHALPWESIPCCRGKEVYRILNLPVACASALMRSALAPKAGSSGSTKQAAAPTNSTNCAGVTDDQQSPTSVFYVLNPSGDLADTQRFFQPVLESQPLWKGITCVRPSVKVLLAALQAHELFLYFGHGSGEQFLPLSALRKLQRCATCLLMGCSSGRLRLHGAYDPSGAVIAYLLAGGPAVVANLWDVTDRDIDRYSQALMQSWLGCSGFLSNSSIASAKSEADASVSEPLGVAVTRSRSACKLAHLIGAAPVCYGIDCCFR